MRKHKDHIMNMGIVSKHVFKRLRSSHIRWGGGTAVKPALVLAKSSAVFAKTARVFAKTRAGLAAGGGYSAGLAAGFRVPL